MADDFKISIHRNSDNLHLKLTGDFDGASARELLNLLKQNSNGAQRIIIHTSSLENIYTFDRQAFHENLLEQNNTGTPIIFTGEKAQQLAPEGNKIC